MQKELDTSRRKPLHYVKPEWVADSVAAGKRLPENRYAILQFSPEPLHPSFRKAFARGRGNLVQTNTEEAIINQDNSSSYILVTAVNYIRTGVERFAASQHVREGASSNAGAAKNDPNVFSQSPATDAVEEERAGSSMARLQRERTIVVDQSSGTVVSSEVEAIPPGLSQSQMVIRLGSAPADICFISHEKMLEASQALLHACRAFVQAASDHHHCDAVATPVSRDQVLLHLPFRDVDLDSLLDDLQRLLPANAEVQLHVAAVKQDILREIKALTPAICGAGTMRRLSCDGEVHSNADTIADDNSISIRVRRRFTLGMSSVDSLRAALECMVQRGFDQARAAVTEAEWASKLIQLTLKWRPTNGTSDGNERGMEEHVFLLDNLSFHQTPASATNKLVLYFTQTTKPAKIGPMSLLFRVINRKDAWRNSSSVQSKGKTVERTSRKRKKPGSAVIVTAGGGSRLDFDLSPSVSKAVQRKQGVVAELVGVNGVDDDTGVEVCVLDDAEFDGGLTNRKVDTRGFAFAQKDEREERREVGLIPKRLSEIHPDVAKHIPAEILREVEEELSRGPNPASLPSKEKATKQEQQKEMKKKLNPTSLSEICPDVAKEIPADILKEVEEELSKSRDASKGFFTRQGKTRPKSKSTPSVTDGEGSLMSMFPRIAKKLPAAVRGVVDDDLSRTRAAMRDEHGGERQRQIRAMPMSCSQIDPAVASVLGEDIMREVYQDLERIKREHRGGEDPDDDVQSGEGGGQVEAEEDADERGVVVDEMEALDAVCASVLDWVVSVTVAEEDRIDRLMEYIIVLINGGCLTRVVKVMRFLQRKNADYGFYDAIEAKVQKEMQRKYGKSVLVGT